MRPSTSDATSSRTCSARRCAIGKLLKICGRGIAGRRRALDAPRGEPNRKRAASSNLAVDLELRLMSQQYVLDDREAQTRSAGGARAAAIDAIKPLGKTWQVFRGNANARIGDRKDAAAVGIDAPSNRDPAARRGIANRVADEIAKCARQLVTTA